MAIQKIHFTSESAKNTQDKLNDNFSEIDTAISTIANQTVKTSSITFGSSDAVEIVGGTNVTVTGDASEKTITIASTDTDTGATSVELKTGDTGNAVTTMSYDSTTRKITFEKSTTFLTSHQDISGKLDKKPDGTNDLIVNNKISTVYIPDHILGQLLYGGTVTGAGVATLSTDAKAKLGTSSNSITLTNDTTAITGYTANEGIYYIASSDGSFASLGLVTGDWLISTGSAWKKIDNTDAVTSVNTKTGAVVLTASDVGAMSATNPTGTGAFSLNRKANTTTGSYSTTLGRDNTASASYSYAEGYNTTASANCAHAEGLSTTASGQGSHAEGEYTTASGEASHAEGMYSTASGLDSHAEGTNTIAQRKSQHTFGAFNIADASGNGVTDKGDYIEIVGNGTSNSSRSNARTLDWSGNEVLNGTSQATGFKTASGTSSQFLKADGSVDSTSYQTAITEYSFTSSDNGWGSLTDGYYTLTITSSKKPFVCYNSSGEQIMAGLKYDGTNIYVITDTKFTGSVWAF